MISAPAGNRAHQALPELTPEQIKRLLPLGEARSYADGELLFEAGKTGPGMFVLTQGTVALTRRDGLETASRRRSVYGAVARSVMWAARERWARLPSDSRNGGSWCSSNESRPTSHSAVPRPKKCESPKAGGM